jgi:hypothetical protein
MTSLPVPAQSPPAQEGRDSVMFAVIVTDAAAPGA